MSAPDIQPTSRPVKGWFIASGVVLGAGGFFIILLALVLAAIKLSGNHIEGPQYGWNAVAYVMYFFQVAISGWGGIFAVIAGVLAAVGLSKGGSRAAGITLLVLSIVFSLQLLFIPVAMTTFDFYIY